MSDKVYFVRNMIYAGVRRQAGTEVPEEFLQDKHHVEKMLRNRLFGKAGKVRMATPSGGPAEAPKEAPAEPAKEEALVEETPTESSDSDVAAVVVDDEDDFQVVYKGVQFEINRNQIREDGTLTAGALKAYKAAIA